jgi:hypothetical protein
MNTIQIESTKFEGLVIVNVSKSKVWGVKNTLRKFHPEPTAVTTGHEPRPRT